MNTELHEFEGLGTKWKILVADKLSSGTKQDIYAYTTKTVLEFEDTYSRFRGSSLIGKLNKHGRIDNPPNELTDMLKFALESAKQTDNYFNIAVGARLEDIGYDKDYSLKKKNTLRKVQNLEDVLSINSNSIEISTSASIDLGGFGKGWLIDKLGKGIADRGIKSFAIDGGGDISVRGDALSDRKVPLEDPFSEGKIIGEIELQNGAVASSSPKHRRWPDVQGGKELHHLVNPKSSDVITSISAVYTHANTATNADTASTCLFVSPKFLHEKIARHYDATYLVVFSDGSFYKSTGYPGIVYAKS
jgi:thiamine biosynthesis lipoprotein